MSHWHERWLAVAQTVAGWSKDQSRKVGCVIVGPNNEMRAQGYNGFPRGVDDGVAARHTRPAKYLWTEHAERNAIYNAARGGISVDGCVMYTTLFPCMDCARAIIQSGIKLVVTRPASYLDPVFAEHFQEVPAMLQEGRVRLIEINETKS